MSLLAAIPYDLFTFGPWELFGPLKIQSFGLLVALGLMLSFHMTTKRAEREFGMSGEEFQTFGMYLVIIGWVFSHVFNVLFYEPEKILEDPLILLKVWGSISSYGGLLGGIIGLYVYKWRHPKRDIAELVDLGSYGLTFAWMFGRFGCASVHDHPGSTTDFFLGITWTDGVVRHDLGFYEALWWIVIVAVVMIADRKPRAVGFYPALVATMYAPARFFFDFLREDVDAGGDIRYFGLTPGHYLSLLLFAVGVYYWVKIWNKPPMVWRKYEPTGSAASGQE